MLVRDRMLVYLATQNFNADLCGRTTVRRNNTGRISRARKEKTGEI